MAGEMLLYLCARANTKALPPCSGETTCSRLPALDLTLTPSTVTHADRMQVTREAAKAAVAGEVLSQLYEGADTNAHFLDTLDELLQDSQRPPPLSGNGYPW